MTSPAPIARCLVSILITAALFLTGCDQLGMSGNSKQMVERHLEKAKRAYEQRDFKGAIEEYEGILRIQPDYARAHFQIAMIYNSNLNDYLNAAYHFQKFLDLNPNASEADLARSYLESARLQFAASVPNSSGQGSPELVRLRSENTALYRQIEDLKRDIVRLRGKTTEPPPAHKSGTTPSAPSGAGTPPPAVTPVKKPATKTAPAARTYTVKKGDGIQSIAERMYGDRSRWRDIIDANPELKGDPKSLKPGQVLNLP
jgi:LysM repeat protein